MSELAELAEARLEGIPRYRPGKPPTGHLAGKLSSNESALGPGPAIIGAISAAARGVGHYPSEDTVIRAVASAHDLVPESVLLTNGSDELCHLVATLFLAGGRTAVLGDPCYAIDATATLLAGGTLTRVPLVGGAHDLDAMAAAAQDAAVLWLPTPHNPTGVAVRPADLERLLASVPHRCLVVVDLAYGDFVDAEFAIDVRDLVDRHPHVLVQRTMSKAQSLAGLRTGVAMARPEIVAALRTARLPFSVNSLGLAAVQAAQADPSWRDMSVARVREGRARLQAELDLLGVEYLPSQANFVLVHLDHDTIREPLARHGISVRDGADLGVPGWTRITVGWAPTMADLRRALREALHHTH